MKRINMKTKNEQDKHRQPYVCPNCEVVAVENENTILAGSPAVQPGGGGPVGNKGSVSIEGPVEDDDDTEISGAKKSTVWDAWEE
ncbi:hypothetical protein Prede_1548 [Prevotella dentalis DSM 3688]|uniref:Uncharacterized protein n=1 Tax=Prevotella dentalis (strain ATCC 49559 / DSM 3688 / JCM 13448 / NCTC 12043 / ES 2772) TaxID=908937 RepID=L0JDE1_PREDD|nr:hypothetical protein [Prevotella dentalis]AGB28858.1 hypothetical protein Prede_1548 [Prevotella dentalis DSM 3688]